MKKFLTSAVFVVMFAVYALYQQLGTVVEGSVASNAPTSTAQTSQVPAQKVQTVAQAAAPPKPPRSSTVTKTPAPAPTPVPTPTPAPAPAPAPKPKGQYIDGTYTGSAADAYYGNIQVKVNISKGKIADVIFLQYPSDRSTSQYINSQAMPYLKQEAIQAQSANVNGVSGATDTSIAFKESLTSALAQAKA